MQLWLQAAAEVAEITDSTKKAGGWMNQEFEQADGKKSYEPPCLKVISLRPEEAVLGHCKIAGGTGPSNSAGPCSILLAGCSSIGS